MNDEQHIVLVVPCYNEAERLDAGAFAAMVDALPTLSLLFVDDGSSDATAEVHAHLVERGQGRIQALALPENRGKGEAVRQGLSAALQGPATIVGYLDADLATPVAEVERLLTLFRAQEDCDVLLGSRVRLLGRAIERDPLRHYLGRAFATAASLVLRLPVYDTQCGTKLFRRTPGLLAALEAPFHSRWSFDVELLGRLLMGAPGTPGIAAERIREEPLQRWTHRKGSKLGLPHMVRSLVDLARIGRDLQKHRHPR